MLVQRQWRNVGDDFSGWPNVSQRMVGMLSAAQLGAAKAGAAYVPQALGAHGYDKQPLATVNPQAFAGIASDGRPLDSLLYGGVVHARESLGRGESFPDAMKAGGKFLDTAVRTQVADAGRGAAGVAVAARQNVGYTRMVSAPCCQRCAVLSGKFFKWNAGFQRHPRCDCRHVPATGETWQGLTSEIDLDQISDLSSAQRMALEDGADLGQIVNARRGLSRNGMTTSEGTSSRGVYGRRSAQPRATPEAIFRTSETREEALDKLRANGYVIEGRAPIRRSAPKPERPAAKPVDQLSDADLEKALETAWESGDNDLADRIMVEIDTREAAKVALPKTRAGQYTEESVKRWTEADFDDELIQLMRPDANGWVDQQAIDQLGHLMDLAEQARKASDELLAQFAREAAEREAARKLLDKSPRRKPATVDEQLRSDYDDYVHVEWLKAEEQCNGVMLNNTGKLAGISPQSLWQGTIARARKYASEELKYYWQRNGRINYSTFRADALGRASDRGARDATTKEGWYDAAG